jgi:hypothetical protein
MNPSGLIIGGKVVPCDKPVYNWHDHGLEFKAGDGARRRNHKTEIDLFVWHWSGGLGDYKAMYRVLDTRELGVEFFIDDGVIYQYADPLLVDTFDAGKYNPRSVGCEIQNWGFTAPGRAIPVKDKRDMYDTVMNGKKRKFARFRDDDIQAAIALGDAVSNAIPSIPKMVPANQDGTLYKDYIGNKWMGNVEGHIGHFHISDAKSDPGHDLLTAFLDSKKFTPWFIPPV